MNYKQARGEWEDRMDALGADRNRWFALSLCALVSAVLTTGMAVWAAVQSQYVPYIVAVDDLGRRAPVVSPKVVSEWPDLLLKRELGDFVSDWRSLSGDPQIVRANLSRIQYYIETPSPAKAKLAQWVKEAQPLAKRGTQRTEVRIISANPTSQTSWLVEWQETHRNVSTGQITSKPIYKGTFLLRQRNITDVSALNTNPLGLIIEDLNIVRISN